MGGSVRWTLAAALLLAVPGAQAGALEDFAFGVVREPSAGAQPSNRRAPAQTRRQSEAQWLVIASRPNPQDAVALAESYAPTLGAAAVFQSTNGLYAIVAGTLNRDKAKPNVEALKALRLVPQDSFLSDGRNLQRIVWHSFEGSSALDLMTRPAYRQSVRRLQAALSRLRLYDGPVDGLVGPSTGVAFEAYLARYGAPYGEFLDRAALDSIEGTAADGFRNGEERYLARSRGFQDAASFEEANAAGFLTALAFSEARTRGFRTQRDYDEAMSAGFAHGDEYVRAKAGGFGTANAYRAAAADGFSEAREHEAFKSSGFREAESFRAARREGFSDRASFDRAKAEKLKAARREAETLLSDADAFLRLNPETPDLLAIAAEAAGVKGAIGAASAPDLAAATLRLRATLGTTPAFDAFEAARAVERAQEAEARRMALRTELDVYRTELSAWVAANLSSEKLPAIVAELKLLTDDARSEDVEVLTRARERASAAIRDGGLAGEIAALAERDEPAAPPAALAQVVRVSPRNAPLLEGAPEDVVVLYNAGPKAPSLTRNLVGAFSFRRDGRVLACMTGVPASPALVRALGEELRRFDASRILLSGEDCTGADVAGRDLLLVQRRGFLALGPTAAAPFLEALENGNLRVFEDMPFAAVAKRVEAEEALSRMLAGDVADGRREGFGALRLLQGRGPICAVAEEGEAAHRGMIEAVAQHLRTELGTTPGSRFASLDETFQAARAERCVAVYASAAPLKSIAEGLKRDGREAAFLSVWFEPSRLDEAVARIESERQEEARAAEARRLVAERERADREREALGVERTREIRQGELRARHGAEAAALLNRFSDSLKTRVLGQPAAIRALPDEESRNDVALLFPAFETWRQGLAPDDWKPIAMDAAIADYGIVQWKERSLEAVALEARVQIVSRERGEYRESCFLLAVIVDGEFGMNRDPVEASCDGGEAQLAAWKLGHQFESRWLVN